MYMQTMGELSIIKHIPIKYIILLFLCSVMFHISDWKNSIQRQTVGKAIRCNLHGLQQSIMMRYFQVYCNLISILTFLIKGWTLDFGLYNSCPSLVST